MFNYKRARHTTIKRLTLLPSPVFVGLVLSALTCGLLSAACAPDATRRQPPTEIVVSAAVSLKDAFTEIANLSSKDSGTKVRFNFGGSGALQKQIESGAPADVFASAGAKEMDELAVKALILPATRKNFAGNVLVLVTRFDGINIPSFTDLTRTEVKKIAIGNPKTVPAGKYTEQTFNALKLLPPIQLKLIYGEDVRQVLDYVVRGEVDAGVVYYTDALSAGTRIKVVARATDNSHEPILYPIAVIKDSHQPEASQKFIDLVLSAEGQSILAKYGFAVEQ